MKKKLIMALLTLIIAVMAAGCGDKKSDDSKNDDKKTETSTEDKAVDTNSKGNVVAVDVDDISKYVKLGDIRTWRSQRQSRRSATLTWRIISASSSPIRLRRSQKTDPYRRTTQSTLITQDTWTERRLTAVPPQMRIC